MTEAICLQSLKYLLSGSLRKKFPPLPQMSPWQILFCPLPEVFHPAQHQLMGRTRGGDFCAIGQMEKPGPDEVLFFIIRILSEGSINPLLAPRKTECLLTPKASGQGCQHLSWLENNDVWWGW